MFEVKNYVDSVDTEPLKAAVTNVLSKAHRCGVDLMQDLVLNCN